MIEDTRKTLNKLYTEQERLVKNNGTEEWISEINEAIVGVIQSQIKLASLKKFYWE